MIDKIYSLIVTGLLVGGCVATNLPKEPPPPIRQVKAVAAPVIQPKPASALGATYDAAVAAGNTHNVAMQFRKVCHMGMAKNDYRLCANAAWSDERKAQHISNMIKAAQVYLANEN